jgi:hypothetical protein
LFFFSFLLKLLATVAAMGSCDLPAITGTTVYSKPIHSKLQIAATGPLLLYGGMAL